MRRLVTYLNFIDTKCFNYQNKLSKSKDVLTSRIFVKHSNFLKTMGLLRYKLIIVHQFLNGVKTKVYQYV